MLLFNPTYLFLILVLNFCYADISNQRLCGDPLCQEPVSYAKTLLRYSSDDTKILSFPPNVEAKVFSKSAGTRLDLWGVEINGKKGYAPKDFLREHRILKSKLEHTVSTDEVESYPNIGVSAQTPTENEDQQNDPFEVVDGTTIFYSTSGSSHIQLQATPTLAPDLASVTSQVPVLNESNGVNEERGSGSLESGKNEITTEDLLLEVEILENGDQKGDEKAIEMVKDNEVKMVEDNEVKMVEDNEVNMVEDNEVKIVEDNDVKVVEDNEVNLVEVEGIKAVEDIEDPKGIVDEKVNLVEDDKEEEDDDDDEEEEEEEEEGSAIYRYISSLLPGEVTNQISAEEKNKINVDASQVIEEAIEGSESEPMVLNEKQKQDEVEEVHTLANDVEKVGNNDTTDGNLHPKSSTYNDPEIQDEGTAKEIEEVLLLQNPKFEQTKHEIDMQVEQELQETSKFEIEPSTDAEVVLKPKLDGDLQEVDQENQEAVNEETIHGLDDEIKLLEASENKKLESEQNDAGFDSISQEIIRGDVENIEGTIRVTEAIEEQISSSTDTKKDIEDSYLEESIDDTPVWHSWYSSIANMFSSSVVENEITENKTTENETTENEFVGDVVVPYGSSDTEQDIEVEGLSGIEEFLTESEIFHESFPYGTNRVLPYLIVTAIAVLVFTLGFYYIEQTKQDAKFIFKINQLEKELLLSKQECFIAKEDFKLIDEELNTVKDQKLQEMDLDVQELEQQNQLLQTELDAATEAGMELNRMLSEFLTSQSSTESLMKSMEQLQEQLNSQRSTMSATNAALLAKNNENDHLQSELTSSSNKIMKLENDLSILTQSLNDLLAEKTRWDEEMSKMQLLAVEAKQLEIDELCETLAARTKELSVLEECIKQINDGREGGSEIDVMLDVGRSKVELNEMTKQRDDLMDRFCEEQGARKLLEDHVQVITTEVEILRLNSVQAEKEKLEANTKLEVLTNYFQEKESQLHKDLGVQEALFNQKSGDISNTYELTKSLQEQANNYKAQNDALKQEILNQERDLRDQIAIWEKKANDNWVSARQAERKLEETKQEAGHLRNLLTVEKQSTKELPNDRLTPRDVNGEVSVPSPIHILGDLASFSPHPHIPFMPPPVQQRLHDQRPPPLGCMSSPPISLPLPLLPPPLQMPPVAPHSASSRHHSFRPLHNNKGSNMSGGNSSDDLDRHL